MLYKILGFLLMSPFLAIFLCFLSYPMQLDSGISVWQWLFYCYLIAVSFGFAIPGWLLITKDWFK